MSPSRSRRRISRKKKSSNTKLILIVALLAVVTLIIGGYVMLGNSSSNENLPINNTVILETNLGDIVIELRADMPITTDNFKKLVNQGVYDGTIFHRVIPDFMIQGGDPTGTGYGDSSIPNIKDEFSTNPENNKNKRATIAMANTGAKDSGSSQFFINIKYNSHLDNLHPVFGDIINGMEVVDAISTVNTDANDKPLEAITIIKAQIID